MHRLLTSTLLIAAMLVSACGGGGGGGGPAGGGESNSGAAANATERSSCAVSAPAPSPLPGVTAAHRSLEYWLDRVADPDAPLLTPAEIAAHNRALTLDSDNGLPTDRGSLNGPPDRARLEREVRTRLEYMLRLIERGEYLDADARRIGAEERSAFSPIPLRLAPALHIALESIPLRCGPRGPGLFKRPIDPAFDRNNCSTVHAQEPIQVLMRWPNGMRLARTRYALGWIGPSARLSAPVGPEDVAAITSGVQMRVTAAVRLIADDGATAQVSQGTLLPARGDSGEVLFADAAGIHSAQAPELQSNARPLTRRAVLGEAFRRLDRAYGWGGGGGGLDCSRFLMDVFATFGLELPRHSARQAASGTFSIDLREIPDLDERSRLIDAAASQGIVLLHFSGHIMLYLGRDAGGTPMVIHSFSEYLEPCDAGGASAGAETLRRVDRVAVSDLTLGADTSRRSFLERIERVVILGQRAGTGLIAVAEAREAAPVELPPPAECDDTLEVRIFHSPERPNPSRPMRIFVTSTRELGPVGLALVDPDGHRHTPEVHRLGGPPFTFWVEVPHPRAGRWRVALGDGANVAACEAVNVSRYAPRAGTVDPDVVWEPRLRWEADTEGLFSAFVEQLFNFPIEEDRTWPNLSVLLEDPAHNLLFDHFGQNEDERIPLRPDCADLPYFLRTYFAWKMRLPFAFRSCTRGRRGRLPVCEELRTPQWTHEQSDPVEAFRAFIHTQVKRGVHSASGRTHPRDSATPLYPIPLTREALRPGTVYADPYGHLLVIARWIPQGIDGYGILVGADAQPDGTVGRRRFWRGSFLFDPDTEHVGAGFKAWRPILYRRRDRSYTALENSEITARRGYVPFSMQQYEGSSDDFYETMEGLINPRALDPVDVQLSLIDALGEAVSRRVVSVNNGERWVAQNPGRTMEMPEDGAIFQTGGPWEEYSTPSRDMRLLIAMDTVTGFPDVVRRNPARFGLTADSVEAAVARTRSRQQEALRERSFTYTRSDGQPQPFTLADVVTRARGFEMSYNPNDCVEIRWAAPERSDEMRGCHRHAPELQRSRMREYREWFATRHRPIW